MNKKEIFENVKYILFGIVAAYLLNFGLGLALRTNLPIVAVVSDSMKHDSLTDVRHYDYLEDMGYSPDEVNSWPITGGFLKGDVLVVTGVSDEDLEIGDVIVYDIEGQSVPIVHRVIDIKDGEVVTKGDHNPTYDPWKAKKIHGKAVVVVPFLGWPKLLLTQIISVFT